MRIIFYCLMALSLSSLLTSPKPNQILMCDVTYENGRYLAKDRELNGEIVDYFDNEALKLKYKVIEGRLHGESVMFYKNGQLKFKRNYTFNKLFGEFVEYDQSGEVKVKFKVDLNAYMAGEKILDLQVRKGNRLKKKGDGIIYFVSDEETPYRSSEEISILDQSSYIIKDDEGDILYKNF